MSASRLLRTQILLEPQQHRALSDIARQENRSLSDVIREMLQNELQKRHADTAATKQRRLATLERIQQHRQEILEERKGKPLDIDIVEMINQMREERDADILGNFISNRD
jgi:hypothetical protein